MEGSEGGGEVRRVNIVYFLSWDGKVEHPHLIRIYHHHHQQQQHHHHHNCSVGVRLRDVKGWLLDLRGKDLPDSFSWSYKRRYKTGYVWQDLKDDDLITPISDNEYVLKGSHIPSSSSIFPKFNDISCLEKSPTHELNIELARAGVKDAMLPAETLRIVADDSAPPKALSRLNHDSFDPHPQADESVEQRTAVFKIDRPRQLQVSIEQENSVVGESMKNSTTSRRASHVFRRILRCGLVETNDSALHPIGRRLAGGASPTGASGESLSRRRQDYNPNNCSKSSCTSGGKSSRMAQEKAIPAIYKPAGAPSCSQCGKAFKPEKLHSHMKSCKALKRTTTTQDSLKLQRQEFSMEAQRVLSLTH